MKRRVREESNRQRGDVQRGEMFREKKGEGEDRGEGV